MKKFISVLCLSVAILLPAGTQAFTLYTPSFGNEGILCSLVNVGNINLDVVLNYYNVEGELVAWCTNDDLAPRRTVYCGFSGAEMRCEFKVKASNPRQTATRGMVRAAVKFTDYSGGVFAFEVK